MNVLKFILICLNLVDCDLIGFNRLGNNISNHDRFRIGSALNPGFNYAYLTNMSPSEKLRLMQLQVLQNQKRAARPKKHSTTKSTKIIFETLQCNLLDLQVVIFTW